MSKWIKKELFTKFKGEIAEDQERKDKSKANSDNKVWQKLQAGTAERPITYEGRLLPDKDGAPAYKKLYYHMFKRGESWVYYLCEKTWGFESFCAYCHASKLLWNGSDADKSLARAYGRKEKFVANFYIVDDPRDSDVPKDIENRELRLNSGKAKLFEFGVKLESKIRQEILDEKEGLGYAIFDPADGHNFIIKVKSTKADAKGNVWPDYADSKFSRSSTALGADKEIRVIMDSCYDLTEYLKSQRKSPTEVKEMLERDMLWGLVQSEWERVYGVASKEEPKAQSARPFVEPVEDDNDVPTNPDEIDDLDEALRGL
jgi:hypothetical protein